VHLLEGIAEYQKRERRYGGLAGDCANGNGSHTHQPHNHSNHHTHHQDKTGRS